MNRPIDVVGAGSPRPGSGPTSVGAGSPRPGSGSPHLAPGRGDPAPTDGALWLACSQSPAFFLTRYGSVYDPLARGWTPFHLWPSQVSALGRLERGRLAVILKARQLGMSWLTVGFALWQMLFRPAATVLLFSQRDDEAVHLLTFRLRGMYDRLPPLFRARAITRDNAHEFRLSNGSAALAFPTTGGRSYTASLVIVDEADHVGSSATGGAGSQDLDGLLNAVKPTIDAGGRLVLLSTVDKTRPESPFKRIYRAAVRGENDYTPIFLPWHAHPARTPEWYAAQARDIEARTGGLDDLHQEYPATDLQALAPRAVDKHFPAGLLEPCYVPLPPIQMRDDEVAALQAHADAAQLAWYQQYAREDERTGARLPMPHADRIPLPREIPGLTLYVPPLAGHYYVIGADPAGGNPQSDESAAVVLDTDTHAQVAVLGLRCDPGLFAAHLGQLGRLYNGAEILVERNNHGHAVLQMLRGSQGVVYGPDHAPGWLTTGASKAQAFAHAVSALRDRALVIHDERTYWQLASIDGGTLAAPPGEHDDRAMACILALAASEFCGAHRPVPPPVVRPRRRRDEWAATWDELF